MCIWNTDYEIYALFTLQFVLWFITCFSYSVGNFIAGLKFFLLGMLAICGWTSVLFSVGLWLLCYSSHPLYAYDLVFSKIYECMPSCHQTSQPKKKPWKP